MKLLHLILLSAISSPTFATDFAEQHSRALALGKLDTFVRYYNNYVHQGVDLMPLFQNASIKDQRQVKAFVSEVAVMPKLRRDGERLVFTVGADEIPVVFPDLRQNQFIISGVAMAFDPSAAPGWQLRLFKAKLDRAGKSESAFFDLFIPKANAFIDKFGKAAVNYGVKEADKKMLARILNSSKIGIVGALGGMLGTGFSGTVKTTSIDLLCTTVTVTMAIDNATTNWVCGDWKAKNVQIAAGTANKQIGYTKDTDAALKWTEEKSFVCPKIASDGKTQLTALIQASEGPNKPVWFKWVGNLEKGEHKTADVYRVEHPDDKPQYILAGTVTFLPSEGINKDPVRVDIPPDPNDLASPDSTRGPTPYRSFDAMPVPENVNYKEAVAARRLISLSNTMKVVAQNCRQTVEKVEAPAGLRQSVAPADAAH